MATKEEIQVVLNSPFGGRLFNLYSIDRKETGFLFSSRVKVTKAMIKAMLEAEEWLKERGEYFDPPSVS